MAELVAVSDDEPERFRFQPRCGKLRLREISRVDVQRVIDEVDVDTLQRFLENITFSELDEDDMRQYTDQGFLKLFRLTQLSLEYLLNVQDTLYTQAITLKSKYLKLRQETKQRLENSNDREQEILHLKKDNKRKAQLIATYQQTLSTEHKSNLTIQNGPSVVPISASAATSISRCPYCPKAFSAPHFLQKHIQRKHRDRVTEQTQIEFQQHMTGNNRPNLDEERLSDLSHSASSQLSTAKENSQSTSASLQQSAQLLEKYKQALIESEKRAIALEKKFSNMLLKQQAQQQVEPQRIAHKQPQQRDRQITFTAGIASSPHRSESFASSELVNSAQLVGGAKLGHKASLRHRPKNLSKSLTHNRDWSRLKNSVRSQALSQTFSAPDRDKSEIKSPEYWKQVQKKLKSVAQTFVPTYEWQLVSGPAVLKRLDTKRLEVDAGPPARARIKGLWELKVAFHKSALESARRRGVPVNAFGCQIEVTRYTHVLDIRKFLADELDVDPLRIQLQAFDPDNLEASSVVGELDDGVSVESGQLFHRRVVCKIVSGPAPEKSSSGWNSAEFKKSVSMSMSQQISSHLEKDSHTSDSLSDSDAYSVTSQSTMEEDSLEASLRPSSLTRSRGNRSLGGNRSMEGQSMRSNHSGSSRGRSNLSGSSRGESFDFAVSNMTSKGGNSLEYSQTAEDLTDVGANTSQPAPAAKSYDRKIQEQKLSNLFLEQQQFRQHQQQQQQQEQVSQQQQKPNDLLATVSDGSLDLEEQLMSDELTDELMDTDLGMTIDKTGVVSVSETSDSIYMDPSDMKGNRDSGTDVTGDSRLLDTTHASSAIDNSNMSNLDVDDSAFVVHKSVEHAPGRYSSLDEEDEDDNLY